MKTTACREITVQVCIRVYTVHACELRSMFLASRNGYGSYTRTCVGAIIYFLYRPTIQKIDCRSCHLNCCTILGPGVVHVCFVDHQPVTASGSRKFDDEGGGRVLHPGGKVRTLCRVLMTAATVEDSRIEWYSCFCSSSLPTASP